MESNNLNTFKILFIVKGVLNSLLILFFLFYIGMGSLFSHLSTRHTTPGLDFNPGIIFVYIGTIGAICCIILAIITFIAANKIGQIRGRNFIIVAASINCITGILGILLCIFTIIELGKPHVKELFTQNE